MSMPLGQDATANARRLRDKKNIKWQYLMPCSRSVLELLAQQRTGDCGLQPDRVHFNGLRSRKATGRPLLLLALQVAVDDLLVALGVERYRQLGAVDHRDDSIAELRVSDPISNFEHTDRNGSGLCLRFRQGSFAPAFLGSGLSCFGVLGASHRELPICLGSEKTIMLSCQCVAARPIAPDAYQGCRRLRG
jgi:hypothetical protein